MIKQLLFILSLLIGFSADAQFTKGTFVTGTGYGQANNTRFSYMEHIAPANPFGHKNPNIVYIAGIDHRGPQSTGPTDYGTIDIIKNKGVAKMVATTNMGLFHKPGGGPTDYYYWNVFTVQIRTVDNVPPFAAIDELIKQRIIAAHGSDVDTNIIVYVGYSLGACGGMSITKDPYFNEKVSMCVEIASGCNASPNYQFVADSGMPIYVYHSSADPTAPVSISDGFVGGLNIRKPIWPIQNYRYTDLTGSPTNDHDRIRFIMEDTTRALSFALTNGDTWYYDELIYETGLRFSKKRRKR